MVSCRGSGELVAPVVDPSLRPRLARLLGRADAVHAVAQLFGYFVQLLERVNAIPGILRLPPLPRALSARDLPRAADESDRQILPAFLFAFFLGVFGVHRFYTGKTGSGVAMVLLTLTVFGAVISIIWATIDWVLIVCGAFEDAEGKKLRRWT